MTKLDVRAARPDQYVAGQKGDWEIIIGLAETKPVGTVPMPEAKVSASSSTPRTSS